MLRNEQFSVKQGDVEVVYYKRPDGTLYSTTRAVVSAATGWICCGLFMSAFSFGFWQDVKQGIRTGTISMGHGHYLYRAVDPVRFDAQLQLDQHGAEFLGATAAVCIGIGIALWIRKRIKGAIS
jgi:hypothetical protein